MNKLTTPDVQAIFDMLTGKELPDGLHLASQPSLTPASAFGVIYFLQEYIQLIPDVFEMCDVCHTIFNTEEDGHYIDGNVDDYDAGIGRSKEDILKVVGKHVCSIECENYLYSQLPDTVTARKG